ncbi:MAG TPA: ATP-grasp domain-containing protein [Candidatus Saccharimonadales bacterium]|jgi:RimK family alpha-L-glutamate ligase|nr:ATP-grasp domain-containing protein [Candidatus Saccharimonadales bacterium]
MNIYVFSKQAEVYAPKRIVEEAVKRGHKAENIFYKDISIEIGPKETSVFLKRKKLQIPDAAVMRVSGEGLKGPLFVYQRVGLIDYFPKNTIVANRNTYIKWPRLNKLEQHYALVRAGLPVIPSFSFSSEESINWDKLKFPLIGKTTFGSSGLGVFKISGKRELLSLAREKGGINTFLYQRFLPTKRDYRVIVIGGKALPAAMQKTAQGKEFRTNFARGGMVERVDLTEEMKYLAENTAKIFDADYAGIDIMYDENGKAYILEINRGAQFQGFEESTGINVASNIVDFLEVKK